MGVRIQLLNSGRKTAAVPLRTLMGLNISLIVYLLSNQKELCVNLAPIISSDKRLTDLG